MGGNEFLVFPDCPVALDAPGGRTVPHASGRPWLVGDWSDDDIVVISAGTRRLAIVGQARVNVHAVERSLEAAGSVRDLDAVVGTIPGNFHLIASIDGRTRVQGTVSTVRQVFTATIVGTTVAASGPGLLAAATGSRVDGDALALRLVPVVPWPLCLRPVWSGVEQVAAGHWLDIGKDGIGRQVRWWRPPASDIPLAEAAQRIRDALTTAVELRADGHGLLSADLSGGMDSTSLCFLVAGTGADLVIHHRKPLDPANDDAYWGDWAADHLPTPPLHRLHSDHTAAWYAIRSHWYESGSGADGPFLWARNRASMEQLATMIAATGSKRHLIGIGGDELFSVLPSYLRALLRRHPVSSIPMVHRMQVLNRWRLGPTLRGLTDRTTFARSFAHTADTLTAGAPSLSTPPLGWRGTLRMPPWATPGAVDIVRDQLRSVAATAVEPLDPERVRHQLIEGVIISGSALRQQNAVLAEHGIDWAAPYLDTAVVEAALSVRMEDRAARGVYKPILAAAMRGVVPDPLLNRRSKGEFTAETYDGLLRNRRALLELCDDLRLARLGLVDADALRTALLSLGPESHHLNPFESTLATEIWLRSHKTVTSPVSVRTGGTR
nr:asparagine synthase-related protein [Kibdelosporangium sp. MJ126-NF4]CEL12832.1 Asparagine synthetase [glutamine-hydrolyzing] [Kibdelosporangium sp. MJ126-NF4]CTQ98518.1 Asparagine synthetase [glutamine-hydrolyzing] (EC 6.3.5.4) [Kibdelosporangium sp. MJ126-NF4]